MNKKNNLTRYDKAEITKKKISMSAYELFKKHGFKEVSVETITKHAGVAKGTFYVHFESKKAMITELADKKVSEIDFDYVKFVKSLPKNTKASEMLLLFSEKITDVMINVLGHDQLSIMYETLLEKSENISSITSYSRQVYTVLNQIIQKGIDTGEFNISCTSEDISKHIFISLRGLTYQWCVLYPNFDLKVETQNHLKLFINGLKS